MKPEREGTENGELFTDERGITYRWVGWAAMWARVTPLTPEEEKTVPAISVSNYLA